LREILGRLLRGEDVLAVSEERTLAPASARNGVLRPLRVLLAEDNLVNQKVAVNLLRKLGHAPDIVGDGRQVLGAVQRTPYDVVLMDCQMPELDGYETTRQLRRDEAAGEFGDRAALYIVALTANAMAGDRERCLACGMDDFLTKPLEETQLRAALHRAQQARDGIPAGAIPPVAAAADVASDDAALAVLDPATLDSFRSLRQAGQPDPVAELVDLFVADLPVRIEALRSALESRDLAAVKVAAHTLKGSASNVGGRRLAARCAALESAAAQSGLPDDGERLSRIEQAASELKVALLAEKAR
ncbi:MAG: response regulator, partial [Verrucomicrobia bacterium]|nr:response regulator [Verrucomicrobiota bacterium]